MEDFFVSLAWRIGAKRLDGVSPAREPVGGRLPTIVLRR
jgi:hypothetical protein